MTIPTITVLPTAPARTDAPAVFNTRADAFLGALYSPFSTQMNASITAINTDVGGIDAAVIAAQLAETNAETAETNAELAETNAGNSATAAGTSAANALTSENAAATTYDNFDDRYLGAFAADPTTDNDGGALLTGAQYFNTASDVTRVYNGSSWQDSAALATSVTVSQISDYTGTAAELNYTDGVTSAIQTQLDSKNALPILKGVSYTAVAGEFVTATAGSITITLPASPWQDSAALATSITLSQVTDFPSQSGKSGLYLTTNGVVPAWATVDAGASIGRIYFSCGA